jgi:TBC1 domain family member 13
MNKQYEHVSRRLCPDLCFFQRQTDYPCRELLDNSTFESLRKRIASTSLKVESQSRSRLTGRIEFQSNRSLMCQGRGTSSSNSNVDNNEYQVLSNGCEAHWEVLERILFVFSKLNAGQSYVQGMNEIIGPIYYTFATDTNDDWRGTFISARFVLVHRPFYS